MKESLIPVSYLPIICHGALESSALLLASVEVIRCLCLRLSSLNIVRKLEKVQNHVTELMQPNNVGVDQFDNYLMHDA